MRRLIALLLIAALLSTGCGPLLPRTTVVPPAVRGAERAAAFRDAARKMLGKRVTVTMLSGEALSGTLRAAGETTLAIYQPDTRTDTPAKRPARATSARTVDLSYDSIRTIRRPASVGSWMFIGAAVLLVTWPLLVYGGYPD